MAQARFPWPLFLFTVFLAGLWLVLSVFAILLMSIATAWLLDPMVDEWESKGRPRGLGILCIFGSFLLVLTAVMVGLLPVVLAEAGEALVHLRAYLEQAPDRIAPFLERAEMWLGTPLVGDAASGASMTPAPGALLKSLFPFAVSGGYGAIVVAMNLLLFPVFTFYMLRDWDRLLAWLVGLVPSRNRGRVLGIAREVDSRISAFVWGQLLVAVFLCLVYCLGLHLVGLDSAVVLGMVAGFLSIVPYLGLFVGLGLSLGLCALQFGVDWHLAATVGVFVGAQLVETLFVTPKIMGEKVGLHPLVVMVVLICGGSIFGVMGTIFAVPMAAAAQVVLGDFLKEYRRSPFFRSGS